MKNSFKIKSLFFAFALQLSVSAFYQVAQGGSGNCNGSMLEVGSDSGSEGQKELIQPKKESVRIGDMLPDFKHDELYKLELKQSEIKDQCSLGTCHIFSFLSELEQKSIAKSGKPIKLSEDYVVYSHWLMRAMGSVAKLDANVDIQFGAYPSQTLFLFRTVGLMPEGVWKPKINYQKDPLAARLVEYMENSMARSIEKAKTVDTLDGKSEVLEEQRAEFMAMLNEAIGAIPKTFEYEGKTYSPQTFAKTFFPEIYEPWVRLALAEEKWNNVDGKGTLKPQILQDSGWISIYQANMNVIEDYLKARLDKGENVFLAYEHNSAYVDNKTGIMAIEAFKSPKNGRVLPRPLRGQYDRYSGGHAVQVVDYDLDPKTGRVKKWKIKNSWGEAAGSKGYYHMYASYFRAFVMEILIPNDGEFTAKLPVEQSGTKTEPADKHKKPKNLVPIPKPTL